MREPMIPLSLFQLQEACRKIVFSSLFAEERRKTEMFGIDRFEERSVQYCEESSRVNSGDELKFCFDCKNGVASS